MRNLTPEDALEVPMSLDEAASELLRGLVKPATLRRAIHNGELSHAVLGRRIVVYADDIREWQRTCRVEAQKGRASGSNQPESDLPDMSPRPNGTSLTTEDTSKARAALLAIAKKLNNSSPNTSPKSERKTKPATVVRIK